VRRWRTRRGEILVQALGYRPRRLPNGAVVADYSYYLLGPQGDLRREYATRTENDTDGNIYRWIYVIRDGELRAELTLDRAEARAAPAGRRPLPERKVSTELPGLTAILPGEQPAEAWCHAAIDTYLTAHHVSAQLLQARRCRALLPGTPLSALVRVLPADPAIQLHFELMPGAAAPVLRCVDAGFSWRWDGWLSSGLELFELAHQVLLDRYGARLGSLTARLPDDGSKKWFQPFWALDTDRWPRQAV
jgi:hypothetical protein